MQIPLLFNTERLWALVGALGTVASRASAAESSSSAGASSSRVSAASSLVSARPRHRRAAAGVVRKHGCVVVSVAALAHDDDTAVLAHDPAALHATRPCFVRARSARAHRISVQSRPKLPIHVIIQTP